MNTIQYIKQSLIFYWRTHLGILSGIIVATAILVGALAVGDSVRYSLRQMTDARLGDTEFAIIKKENFFRSELATDIASLSELNIAPVLQIQGIAKKESSSYQVNKIQVNGIDPRFWTLMKIATPFPNLEKNEAIINERLANKLKLKPNDYFILRFAKPDLLPNDAPLAANSKNITAIRLRVNTIAADSDFGNFSLQTSQIPPYNVFLPLDQLSDEMDVFDRANLLLIDADKSTSIESVKFALNNCLMLEDIQLNLVQLKPQKTWQISSENVFLSENLVEVINRTISQNSGVFSYFVNEIKIQNRATPYSFVSALDESLLPSKISDDEIIINEWLAEDLQVQINDTLELKYFIPDFHNELIEKRAHFKIKAIVPLTGSAAEKNLMPLFPGLSGTDNCSDWEPGIPLNLSNIREKDEEYWDIYQGTPKAFVTLPAAKKMWGNRFGNLTAIRFYDEANSSETISKAILSELNPEEAGFIIRSVLQDNLSAGVDSVDFGQLFIGLSFFIEMAALILTALLFVFGLEKRRNEFGNLLALGFSINQIRNMYLKENTFIIAFGVIFGVFAGLIYNAGIIQLLNTFWRDAVGTSNLQPHVTSSSILIGFASGFILPTVIIWLTIKKLLNHSLVELQQKAQFYTLPKSRQKFRMSAAVGIICFICAVFIIIFSAQGQGQSVAAAFFTAGALLLTSGIALLNSLMVNLIRSKKYAKISLLRLGIRNCVRNRIRSLATIGLLACGIFIIISIGSNRHNPTNNAASKKSGTGGYKMFGETSIPVLKNLNSSKYHRELGLKEIDFSEVHFEQMKFYESNDASCLNLNRIKNPHILGINLESFNDRNAFSFLEIIDKKYDSNPWQMLAQTFDAGVIPAIADQTVIIWGLGKSIGDTLIYVNETGQELKLKLVGGLANSIFQGNILISEHQFIEHFPTISGHQFMLIDLPENKIETVNEQLSYALNDLGLDLISTGQRLAEFNAIENTYLDIFTTLGGLGLILGTLGLGIVVMRNTLDRRSEFALLRAIGYSKKVITKLLMTEHIFLLGAGVFCGTAAAFITVLPSLMTPGADPPYLLVIGIVLLILLNGIFWTYFSIRFAMSNELLSPLRNE